MDSRKGLGVVVPGAPAQGAVDGAKAAAADVSAAVDDVLRGLDGLEGVARALGADIRSLGLVRCARDAVLAVRDRHRHGAFKTEVRLRPR